MATRSVTPVRMNRWAILAGYGLLAACSQLLWLSFAPITTQTHRVMGVSVGAAGDLAGIFPLMYVILALPCGRWLDARFERALSVGAILTAGGGLLRLAGPSSYGWVLAGQFVVAAGQPLVLNSITKVAARYFPPEERTAAISVGSVSLYRRNPGRRTLRGAVVRRWRAAAAALGAGRRGRRRRGLGASCRPHAGGVPG